MVNNKIIKILKTMCILISTKKISGSGFKQIAYVVSVHNVFYNEI